VRTSVNQCSKERRSCGWSYERKSAVTTGYHHSQSNAYTSFSSNYTSRQAYRNTKDKLSMERGKKTRSKPTASRKDSPSPPPPQSKPWPTLADETQLQTPQCRAATLAFLDLSWQ
jgi:hypothetical protein